MSRNDYGPDSEPGEGVEPTREDSMPSVESAKESVEAMSDRAAAAATQAGDASVRRSLLAGGVAGVGAHLLAFLVAIHYYRFTFANGSQLEEVEIGAATYASWVFFNMFGIGLEQGGEPVPLRVGGMLYIGSPVLSFVGLGLLIAAGYLLAKRVGSDRRGAVAAAGGFLAGCLALAYLFATQTPFTPEEAEQAETVLVPTSDAVLYAGIAYPLACGLVGAAIYWGRRGEFDAILDS